MSEEKSRFQTQDRLSKILQDNLSPCPFCRSGIEKLEIVRDGDLCCVSCSVCKASGPLSRKSIVASFLWGEAMDNDITGPIDNYQKLVSVMESLTEVLGDE